MKTAASLAVGVAYLLMALPSAAHHAFASEFDVNRPVELTGTVTKVEWTNPHAWFYLDVETDAGVVENWAIELLGINTLMRQGWTRNRIKPGDVLYVKGFRARNGTTTGNASIVVVVETGEQIWGSPAGKSY